MEINNEVEFEVCMDAMKRYLLEKMLAEGDSGAMRLGRVSTQESSTGGTCTTKCIGVKLKTKKYMLFEIVVKEPMGK